MSSSVQNTKSLQSRLLSGSAILLAGSAFASAINFAYNFVVARFLGPADFGHATAVYTILILISSVTLSFQIVAAKVVAQQGSPEGKSAAYHDSHRSAWIGGIVAAALLLLFERPIADYLNLPDPLLVVLMAAGVAFYVPLGSRRGYIQGACSFSRLAGNLVLEGVVRLAGSVLLILMGFGVQGVIVANSVGVAVAYLAIAPSLTEPGENPLKFGRAFHELFTALVFFSGLALINNSGIFLVKHYFPAVEAGLYAAVAMVGRVIFAFSTAVVNGMFPIAAEAGKEGRQNPKIIRISLLLVLGIGVITAACLRFTPSSLWRVVLGPGFELGGGNALSSLMPLYAVMTTVYSLSVVVITHEMSYKIANTSWVQLGISGLVIAAVCLFHSSLLQVILVQLALMAALLFVVACPYLFTLVHGRNRNGEPPQPIRLLRRVSEDQVIAEFLRNEVRKSSFRDYREKLGRLVMEPDIENEVENLSRRAFLLLRHWRYWSLWRQLPPETEWYEAELNESDIEKIQVFPRAQWRNLARGNFSIRQVAGRMRSRIGNTDASLRAKIIRIRKQLLCGSEVPAGAVLLIGISESDPLTILDGNHRMLAAMLESPAMVGSLHFYCGLSPRMTRCCWYKTNPATLLRYGSSLLARWVRGPDPVLKRFLKIPEESLLAESVQAAAAGTEPLASGRRRFLEETTMTFQMRRVLVLEAPATLDGRRSSKLFLKQFQASIQANRPRIVLDCSTVLFFSKPLVHLLLCCLEEAMKRNGDLRVAGLPPGAQALMDITGACRLFEVFDTVGEAVESFQEPPAFSPQRPAHVSSRTALNSEEAAS